MFIPLCPSAARASRGLISLRFLAVLGVSLGLAGSAMADPDAFGPWDAGKRRSVVRKGKKGLSRSKHPVVGEVAKVPSARPKPPLRNDPDVAETLLLNVNVVEGSMSSNPLFLAALVYRHFLTKVDGPKCQHLPTCSRFASQAVARNGPVGIAMGLDRVIRPPESSAVRTLPEVEGWGGVRHLDPVENYEFWHEENFTGFPPATDEQPLRFESEKSTARVPMAPYDGPPEPSAEQTAATPPATPRAALTQDTTTHSSSSHNAGSGS